MAPFRFLDLAPELRNNVYEQALTHDRSKGIIAAAGLLRTCRQVYRESKDVLYAQSTFTIKTTGSHTLVRACTLSGDMKTTPIGLDSTMGIFQALPRHLLKLSRIHIEVPVVDKFALWRMRYTWALNRFMYALVDLLNSNVQSRRLEVCLKLGCPQDIKSLVYIGLWPLRKLRQHVEVHLQGTLSLLNDELHNRTLEYRERNLATASISDYLLLATADQSGRWPRDAATYIYGHECFKIAQSNISSVDSVWVWDCLKDADFTVRVIAAKTLPRMSTREELEAISKPPDWLFACLKLVQKSLQGNAGRHFLSQLLGSMKHLVDAIEEEDEQEKA